MSAAVSGVSAGASWPDFWNHCERARRRRARALCGFCQKPKHISEEHIFARWISELLGAHLPDMTVRHTLTRDNTTGAPWFANRINQVVRMPCTDCNGGWMSDLESYVAPIISPMILDQGLVTLGLIPQVVVARWAMRIA